MNKYKQFVEETGQGLRFTAWEYNKKVKKRASHNLNKTNGEQDGR